MMRAKCKEYAVNDTECTFQSVLQRMNLTEGIRFEFNRFVVWSGYGDIDEILSSFQFIDEHRLLEMNRNVYLRNLKLEKFKEDFNGTMKQILVDLGVDQLEGDVMEEQIMKAQRDNKASQRNKDHITKGTFNESEQIDILLNDKERCRMLKQWTVAL